MKRKTIYLFLLVGLTLLMQGCSSKNSPSISKTFHNTTSHYNGYYYAQEHIKSIEQQIQNSIVNDYDEILTIFPKIDSSLANSYQEEIDEAIKMASLAIQRHPGSKWTDDAYLLIGLARHYSLDYVNAIQTFKYINTKSDNDNTRHTALIYLIRSFTDYGEYGNAVAVSDYLKKEKLNNHNQKLLHIYRAYYYQVRNDLDNMLTNLVNAAPDLGVKDGKARMYFILAQNYQALNFQAEAYNYYKKCLSANPEYELEFYSKLHMAQVVQLSKNSTIKEVRKEFRKMLKDKKNKEFKDKIYYEMAEFEMRQNDIDLALGYYQQSAHAGSNKKQKGLSYLKMGRIYYDTLKNYQFAKAYYDSSINNLPPDFEEFEQTQETHRILSEFVKHYNTIHTQDSLLRLSNMDSASLVGILEAHVEAERQKEEELKEKQKQQEIRANVFDTGRESNTANWYFGNPAAMAMGENEFVRIWGDVTLEDNWRRSSKEQVDFNETNTISSIDSATKQNNQNEARTVVSSDEEINKLYNTIPFSEEEKKIAHEKIENAYYELGKVYHFDLEESHNAVPNFETLLSSYPESDYNTEVMYLLYLIYNQSGLKEKADLHKNNLLSNFPNSTYSRLIVNPNYTQESSKVAEKLLTLYDSAYNHFLNNNFEPSKSIIRLALTNYQQIKISDRFKILNILITGKTEDIAQYQYELDQFIKTNPESDYHEYAQSLLDASFDFQDRTLKSNVKFIEHFEQEHYVVIAYRPKSLITEKLASEIETFNSFMFDHFKLQTSNLILEENYLLAMISEFSGPKNSLVYLERLKSNKNVMQVLSNSDYSIFSITKENFEIFYKTKEVRGYMRFFNEHY